MQLIAASALSGCAAPALVTRDTPGDPFEGGIGGTGIVGTLTDFGSLIVNGLRVELTSRTRMQSPFGPASESMLRVGQPLTVVANRSADRMVARHVRLSWPLIGTVRRDATGLRVNGIPVATEPGAIGQAVAGARVIVSGTWSGRSVVASRFDPAGSLPDLLAGVVETGADGPTIAGISLRGERGPVFLANGSYATATGRYDGGAMVAARISAGRFTTGASALRQLSVEGYLEQVAQAPGYRVAGLGHSFARDLRLDPLARRRALFFGPYDGLFGARAGYVMPDSFSARRRLLREGFTEEVARRVVRTR